MLWIWVDLAATKSTTVGRAEIAATSNPIDSAGDFSEVGAPDHLVLGKGRYLTPRPRGGLQGSGTGVHFDPPRETSDG
jgi:hypothetical protein